MKAVKKIEVHKVGPKSSRGQVMIRRRPLNASGIGHKQPGFLRISRLLTWAVLFLQIIPLTGLDQAVAWDYNQRTQENSFSENNPLIQLDQKSGLVFTSKSHKVSSDYADLVLTISLRMVSDPVTKPELFKAVVPTRSMPTSHRNSLPIRSSQMISAPLHFKETLRSSVVRFVHSGMEKNACSLVNTWIGPSVCSRPMALPMRALAGILQPLSARATSVELNRLLQPTLNPLAGESIHRRACGYLVTMNYFDVRQRFVPGSEAPVSAPLQGWISAICQTAAPAFSLKSIVKPARFGLMPLHSKFISHSEICVFTHLRVATMHFANGPPKQMFRLLSQSFYLRSIQSQSLLRLDPFFIKVFPFSPISNFSTYFHEVAL